MKQTASMCGGLVLAALMLAVLARAGHAANFARGAFGGERQTAAAESRPAGWRGASFPSPPFKTNFDRETSDTRFSFVAAPPPQQRAGFDGSVVYMVSNSHIDTQWNWTVQDTIRQWVPRTFFDNFKLFEQFPNYKFNFEGVIHYMFFKEHHPEAWPKVQSYVAQGRWKLAGSWLNAVDTNVPSPESLMRQALYGKRFFKREFGHASEDIYLPDCFGFSYALPSIAAHSGFRSFSTQKLTWGGAIPSPFAVGRWQGVDGSSLIASLRGGNYVAQVRSNPTSNSYWGGELTELGGGKRLGFRYFGVGDQGGTPDDLSVAKVEEGLTKPNGPVQIRHTAAEQLGDAASVFDKEAGSELLHAPAGIELLDNKFTELWDDKVVDWPAWEIKWETLNRRPAARLNEPSIKVVEHGPVRVALEITRRVKGSTFVQHVSLTEGGDRLDFDTRVDWKTPGMLVKAAFPLRASNPKATFDLGLGTIERGNSHENLYEVPGQQWADVTDAGGAFGASILNDSKYGWDKPADNLLRLTLLHTPAVNKRYVYQGTNDIGRHRFAYAIAGHKRDWRVGRIPARAARLNQPLEVFQTTAHAGRLGKSFSLLSLKDDGENGVAVRALKKAEDSDEIVLRVQELHGRPARAVQVALADGVASAREINAAEEETTSAHPPQLDGGKLIFNLNPYQPRSFALKLRRAARTTDAAPRSTPLALPFNLDGISTDALRRDGDFDGRGRTIPAKLLPAKLTLGGVNFKTGDATAGARNVVVAEGQRIKLPGGDYNRLYLIAAAVGTDTNATFTWTMPGNKTHTSELRIQDWSGVTGQWDSQLVDDRIARETFAPPEVLEGGKWADETIFAGLVMRLSGGAIEGLENLRPAFIKRDEVAWIGTHRHAPGGNEPYIFCNLFKYRLDIPAGATTLTLPNNSRIRIMAVSAAKNAADETRPAALLYE